MDLTSTTSGTQDITVAGSIQIQSGTNLTGSTTFSIEPPTQVPIPVAVSILLKSHYGRWGF